MSHIRPGGLQQRILARPQRNGGRHIDHGANLTL
jgi:hypothetical protein